MFIPISLTVNRTRMKALAREHVVEENGGLVISWGATGAKGNRQRAYVVRLSADEKEVYNSGWIETDSQECHIPAGICPKGVKIDFAVKIRDDRFEESAWACDWFMLGDVEWTAKWISADDAMGQRTLYFRRDFSVSKPVRRAVLYACGIGYHKVYLNGIRVDDVYLDPANTDYSTQCQYVVWPDVGKLLTSGENCIGVMVGGGWRDNYGPYLKNPQDYAFFGKRQLRLMMKIEYEDGDTAELASDESWSVGSGASVRCHLFDGEDYDANETRTGWNLPGCTKGFAPVALAPETTGCMRLMCIPPIKEMGLYPAKTISEPAKGVYIIDFGQNIAGVCRMKLKNLSRGQRIRITHAEELDEDGRLYTACLRGAKATDTYTASGDERDLSVWQPDFTYHGFRYACVEGYDPDISDIEAVLLHTDMESPSFFVSGSAQLNALQQMVVMTERDNMHSILTDCPQRDERMGWMNDATVRFEETPYNFECASMFRKIVRDLKSLQRPDGAIACTAPYVYGAYPADPVCSSYLVAAWQAYLHYGDVETMREGYDGFVMWEKCLLSHSDDYIVNYSYYGDWAGPEYACDQEGVSAKSIVTPGVFMSTGYSYFNCMLLSKMARILEKEEDCLYYADTAEKIKAAMLLKWYDGGNAVMATGSMACQAFSLWLGIIPTADREKAAKKLRNDLVNADYAFTTGNLCTRYMMEVLSEYGYSDEAYHLATSDEYPSWGYMRQNEATTVWERFELKKDPGMNSHNHPMFGAVGAYLYSHIAGVRPTEPAYSRFSVKPYMPKRLLSAQASLDTPKGRINVRWTKRYAGAHLYVDVPFGSVCDVEFMGIARTLESGTHAISVPLDQ